MDDKYKRAAQLMALGIPDLRGTPRVSASQGSAGQYHVVDLKPGATATTPQPPLSAAQAKRLHKRRAKSKAARKARRKGRR